MIFKFWQGYSLFCLPFFICFGLLYQILFCFFSFAASYIAIFVILSSSGGRLFHVIFPFHAFVLKQKVEPKIQAHSMRTSSLCGKSFGEWAIGPLRNPTARAARLCLGHFHRTPVSRWSPMSTALNFSLGKEHGFLKRVSEK